MWRSGGNDTKAKEAGARPATEAASKPASKPASKTATKTASKASKPAPGAKPKAAPKTEPKTEPKTAAQAAAAAPMAPFLRGLAVLAAFAATVAFSVVLARLTLEPSAASEPLAHSNVQPGSSIRDYLSQPAFRDTVKQLGGNVLLGVPFGVLLPVLMPKTRGLVRVVLATAAVMVLVELVQGALVTGRAFDVDDVILNTTGAVLGYLLIGRRLGRAVHPRRRHWWHRRPGGTSASGA
ncbi:VanZ family protein [Streptomyces tirandamycinicus]|uniref:VanZ family protein n=1 Tax=Streptomyces tirandamycinicus TaxID=2174846 RepID=UPI002271408C|nr:VanZ family protein [Streptomyces tirandamycinicus]MCY0982877.1 VanZ family protein [Streptomyces tirandamycinicus]